MRSFWKKEKYYLNKMTLKELIIAYFQHYSIQSYIAIGLLCGIAGALNVGSITQALLCMAAAILLYPSIWYITHRYILHGTWLAKSRYTAKLWKRIHFDHHQDPNDLEILFGALSTTLPTMIFTVGLIGYAIAGLSGLAICVATDCFITCFYEFCHCIQHLAYTPKNKFAREIKKLHLAHHFHNEKGNYGITNYFYDKIMGTHYTIQNRPEKSPTVFNLGYDEEMAARYPWVKKFSGNTWNNSMKYQRKNSDSVTEAE
jgi:sterol desaturase/sphingolipid hydroxylase (fatty acid hydroxylase superfamily)